MSGWGEVVAHWEPRPEVVLGCVLLAGAYLRWMRGTPAQVMLFLMGAVVLLLALISPLDVLSDYYLFSAHMLQHLLLVLVVPPLLILGLRESWVRALYRLPVLRKLESVLGNPLAAWPVGMMMMLGWHVPALYNAALESEPVHALEHLLFLVSATIFWWPVLAPDSTRAPMPLLGAMAYLFTAMAASSLLGIFLTFTPPGLYPRYVNPVDELGLLVTVRGWGMTPARDQQLAGLLMWIPSGVVYLLAALRALAYWFEESEETAWAEQG